jgi:tetratricopeptide (TPR) repeat protein
LYFGLGKALDDLKRYEEAIAAYNAANALGKLRNPPYDRLAAEKSFGQLISVFDTDWIKRTATQSTATPIFVCGMFRSGSTLIEQILAAHPLITAAGELDSLPWLLARRLAPLPQVANTSREELQQIGDEYLASLKELFPNDENIVDKRPDNFLRLGLIRSMFPSARIVYTKRALKDNCLSVYFQQLDGHLSYATDLEDIAHYYNQHEHLMVHWNSLFGDNIYTVDYDELVQSPKPVLQGLIDFLGFEWDDRCLSFQQTDSLVKTASVWQVREKLHSASSGRWRNYESFMPKLQASLKPESV